jgi:NTP pyrophosphatase (non-canonical NTP hydrolase)
MAITALGFTGEAGEVVEFFKKHLRDGKEIHRNEELALELGDAIFYWARLCMYVGFTPEEVLQMNKDKLNARYAELRKQRGVA